jgi:DNA-binding NarL/FixJ family response regulator
MGLNDGRDIKMLSRPRILIADDHFLMAELCKRLLETEYDVVGIVGNGLELVNLAPKLKPDVIVLDISMPILSGLDASERLKHVLPATKLVFLTVNTDVQLAVEAFHRGASAYLIKTCASKEVLAAVHSVLQGKPYLSSALSRDEVNGLCWVKKASADGREQLTERQREVLQLLAEGRLMKEIADKLNMSTRTVAFHKYRMMHTLGARNTAELIIHAVRLRMITA